MEYVIYKGQKIQSYNLLHNGILYPIPFLFSEKQAHKILDPIERTERIWEWMFNNMGKLGILFSAVLFISIVLLNL